MTTYLIRRQGKPSLEVTYEGVPPCLWCGEPVFEPSMDGPLVCGLCDSGLVVDEGGVRKWTEAEHHQRAAHLRAVVAAIEASSVT